MSTTASPHLRAEPSLLRIEDLTVDFRTARGTRVSAVAGVSLDILAGETLGIVGESGCGKTTLVRSIMQIVPASSGTVCFEGLELGRANADVIRRLRQHLQMIFQDPISSLNPRRRVHDIVAEPLRVWGFDKQEIDNRVSAMLDAVGLPAQNFGARRPHELSGGQCQRVSIARALILGARMLVCDEAVSALDVSVQAQILNLLEDSKERFGLSMLFIAHDLAVVKSISDRIGVMYLGKLVEIAPANSLYANPAHPYTAALLDAAPRTGRTSPRPATSLAGEPPSPTAPPSGCRFRTRCPHAQPKCTTEEPPIAQVRPGHFAACHFPLSVRTSTQSAPETEG